jgi:hypothetical protein
MLHFLYTPRQFSPNVQSVIGFCTTGSTPSTKMACIMMDDGTEAVGEMHTKCEESLSIQLNTHRLIVDEHSIYTGPFGGVNSLDRRLIVRRPTWRRDMLHPTMSMCLLIFF